MSTYNAAAATVIKATCQGATSAGGLGISGLLPGDVLMKITPTGFEDGFEDVISVAGQIQQVANLDWSPVDFIFYLLRGV